MFTRVIEYICSCEHSLNERDEGLTTEDVLKADRLIASSQGVQSQVGAWQEGQTLYLGKNAPFIRTERRGLKLRLKEKKGSEQAWAIKCASCPYLSGCPVLHLQLEWSVKTLDVSKRREIHLVLVKLELQSTETHRSKQPAGKRYPLLARQRFKEKW